jgi:hypothetical protein
MTATTLHFYRDLSPFKQFSAALETTQHATLPQDWWIVIADIAGSTQAIAMGDYKSVNTVGVACIAAVSNVDRQVSLPFVFGGDGATFAIPDALKPRVEIALRGTQQLAMESFGLDLRVGLIRVSALLAQGDAVQVAKVRLSKHVAQAVFSGAGWQAAERAVKGDSPDVVRVRPDAGTAEASFEGFECRWQGVPSFKDHKLALLVLAMGADAGANLLIYQHVMDNIQKIYGDVAQYHPLRAGRMRLTFDVNLLNHEWRVRVWRFGWMQRAAYLARILLQNIAGYILFKRNMDTDAVKWSQYRQELVDNADFRKFDCMLRMIMDGEDAQSDALEAFLQAEFQAGRLVYGMHRSKEALVTCIVESCNGKHMHFVDGSDGGYALAALALKQRLSARV